MARNGKWDFSKKNSRGSILEIIKNSPGITANEIGNSTLIRVTVQDFIRLGYIVSEKDSKDNRKNHLTITRIGDTVLSERRKEYENN